MARDELLHEERAVRVAVEVDAPDSQGAQHGGEVVDGVGGGEERRAAAPEPALEEPPAPPRPARERAPRRPPGERLHALAVDQRRVARAAVVDEQQPALAHERPEDPAVLHARARRRIARPTLDGHDRRPGRRLRRPVPAERDVDPPPRRLRRIERARDRPAVGRPARPQLHRTDLQRVRPRRPGEHQEHDRHEQPRVSCARIVSKLVQSGVDPSHAFGRHSGGAPRNCPDRQESCSTPRDRGLPARARHDRAAASGRGHRQRGEPAGQTRSAVPRVLRRLFARTAALTEGEIARARAGRGARLVPDLRCRRRAARAPAPPRASDRHPRARPADAAGPRAHLSPAAPT